MSTLYYNNIKFNYTKSSLVEEREFHDYNELLYYIGGGATLRTETFSEKLTNNSLVFIPKGKFHTFRLENPSDFARVKISIPDQDFFNFLPKEFLTEIRILNAPNELLFSTFEKIRHVLTNDNRDKNDCLLLYGSLIIILSEFSKRTNETFHTNKTVSLVYDCIKYIENNLSNDLSLKTISNKLNFSPSALSHSFKKEMGVSLHQYILQKRLIFARTLISNNYPPTTVYTMCGYTNYSSFYKAYLKMFAISPSDNIE